MLVKYGNFYYSSIAKLYLIMQFFVKHFKWIMLVSGVLTCTMLTGLFAPQYLVESNFGEAIEGSAAEIIVRNWSALIGLMGIMLISGAFVRSIRKFCLLIAGISKLIFIMLVLSIGRSYLEQGIGTAVIVDSIMVVLYAVYLAISAMPAIKHSAG
jgi:hypothetical protein